jgi:CrcB protein
LLNSFVPTLPLDTLAANLIGGYLVGVAIAFFSEHADLPAEARLIDITSLMVGLPLFPTSLPMLLHSFHEVDTCWHWRTGKFIWVVHLL